MTDIVHHDDLVHGRDFRDHHVGLSPALVLKGMSLAVLAVAWAVAARDALTMLGLHAVVDTFGSLAAGPPAVAARPAPIDLDLVSLRMTIYFALYIGPTLFMLVLLV